MQLILKDDKLQKYRDHLLHGGDLSETDKNIFDRYFFAFTNLLDGMSERQVVELLMSAPAPLGRISQSQAYNVVNGSQAIFGALDFGNAKRVAQRYIYATRLEELAKNLEDLARKMVEQATLKDDRGRDYVDADTRKEAGVLLEKSANVLMKAGKIKGLLEKDKVENPNRYKVAPNIIFTDDLGALEMVREIEDAQFEDVTGNEGQDTQGEAETAGQ